MKRLRRGPIIALAFVVLICSELMTVVSSQALNNTSVSAPATEWQQKLGEGESTSQVIQTKDDGYSFLDLGWNHQYTTEPAILYKIDSSGNPQWQKTINSFHANGLVQTIDGGIAILGEWNWDPNSYAPNHLYRAGRGGNPRSGQFGADGVGAAALTV